MATTARSSLAAPSGEPLGDRLRLGVEGAGAAGDRRRRRRRRRASARRGDRRGRHVHHARDAAAPGCGEHVRRAVDVDAAEVVPRADHARPWPRRARPHRSRRRARRTASASRTSPCTCGVSIGARARAATHHLVAAGEQCRGRCAAAAGWPPPVTSTFIGCRLTRRRADLLGGIPSARPAGHSGAVDLGVVADVDRQRADLSTAATGWAHGGAHGGGDRSPVRGRRRRSPVSTTTTTTCCTRPGRRRPRQPRTHAVEPLGRDLDRHRRDRAAIGVDEVHRRGPRSTGGRRRRDGRHRPCDASTGRRHRAGERPLGAPQPVVAARHPRRADQHLAGRARRQRLDGRRGVDRAARSSTSHPAPGRPTHTPRPAPTASIVVERHVGHRQHSVMP